jgi:hypothetical protein
MIRPEMIRVAWAHRVGVSQELDGCHRRIKMALGVIVCGGERTGVAVPDAVGLK